MAVDASLQTEERRLRLKGVAADGLTRRQPRAFAILVERPPPRRTRAERPFARFRVLGARLRRCAKAHLDAESGRGPRVAVQWPYGGGWAAGPPASDRPCDGERGNSFAR
jgi:hypothetical protein